jgi:CubicO group peptidase (beta-lactamase class C family)
VDAGGIAAFTDAIEKAPDLELHSLMIVRHGHVIASGWWEPYGPDRPHLLYSLSKSFTSTAAGLAAGEGVLDLDTPVLSYFPELEADVTDPRSRAMLVRHIASMSSGHLADTWPAAPRADREHPVRGFLRMPPERDPGTVFTYNQSCTYTLATIVQRVTGQHLIEYLRPRLFDAIGIGSAAWEEHPAGQVLGFSGLYVTTDAIARLGELYLRGGQWRGRQVLPKEWVAEATRKQIATSPAATPDWRQGYGFQFWMARHGFRGDGAFGQFCLVLPEHDAVVAITSGTENLQGVLDAVWEHVLPAFGGPGTGGADAGTANADTDAEGTAKDAVLARRLAGLRLPVRPAGPGSGGPGPGQPGEPAVPVVLTPAGGTCEAQPTLRQVEISGQTVTLREDALPVEVRIEDGRWHVTEGPAPVAASGGWTDSGTLVIDVVFLETPHCLTLTCSPGDGTFRAAWKTPPLSRYDLGRLRSPAAP